MTKLIVVMPAYNEAENIEETVKQWYTVVDKIKLDGADCEMVVCNDGSKDDTFQKLLLLKKKYPDLTPLDKENSGHGATILYLYRYAIENGADFIFQTDSDGQTSPSDFWEMWNRREDFDIQIGNRYSRQDGIARIFVSRVLRLVVFLIFHESVKDANTPFRLMKVDKLRSLLVVIPPNFFLSNVAITAIAQKWNFKIGWRDISFKPRQGGANSINMKRIIKIGWKALGDFRIVKRNVANCK